MKIIDHADLASVLVMVATSRERRLNARARDSGQAVRKQLYEDLLFQSPCGPLLERADNVVVARTKM